MNLNVKACGSLAMAVLLLFCSLVWADAADLVWSTFLGGNSDD